MKKFKCEINMHCDFVFSSLQHVVSSHQHVLSSNTSCPLQKSGPGTREGAKSERSRTAALYGLLAGGQHTVYDFLRMSVIAAAS